MLSNSRHKWLIDVCKEIVEANQGISLVFEARSSNKVVDSLAKSARKNCNRINDMYFPCPSPVCINDYFIDPNFAHFGSIGQTNEAMPSNNDIVAVMREVSSFAASHF